jgi:mRNA interferase RelE/StbE
LIWRVDYAPSAVRDLKKLPPGVAAELMAAVDRYALTGEGDVTRLVARTPPTWRLRVGEWRAVFRRDKSTVTVTVIQAGHRRDVYER